MYFFAHDCMSKNFIPFSKDKTVHSGRISPNCIGQTDKSEGGLYTKFSLYWSKKLRSRYSSIVKKVKGKFGLLKVRQSRNVFFKATILPKNEFVFFAYKQYYERILKEFEYTKKSFWNYLTFKVCLTWTWIFKNKPGTPMSSIWN